MSPKLVMAISALSVMTMPAQAQTYTVYSVRNGDAGTVAAATTGTTVFQVWTARRIVSGNGNYISGNITSAQAVISCSDGIGSANSCANNSARVVVTRTGATTGRGQTLSDIGIETVGGGSLSGHTYDSAGGGGLDATLTGWTAAGNLTVQFGMWLPVLGDNGSSATTATSQFLVAVAKSPNTPSGGMNGIISATVRRSLTITKVSDLRFGTFIRPTSGTDTIAIDTSGNRGQADSSGNYGQGTVVLVPSTYGAAQFTIKGEPNTTLTISLPATFTMTGPGAALTVTLNPSATGNQTIPGSGTLTLTSGGYFSVGASQASGSYSGSFTVTIAYN